MTLSIDSSYRNCEFEMQISSKNKMHSFSFDEILEMISFKTSLNFLTDPVSTKCDNCHLLIDDTERRLTFFRRNFYAIGDL
jgi:hypothetical protein